MPKISVIIPVYNVEKYLHRCIDSILSQTFKDFELILINDGSTDNSPKICDEYKEKDSRVIVMHIKNGGPSIARNIGLDWIFANSNSEWIAFIDSDDWIHTQYLERLYNAVLDNDVKISACDYIRMISDATAPIEDEQLPKIITPEDFWCENQICATVVWGKIYKKELWENIRYPEGKIHEDEYIIYKVLFACEKMTYISNKMYLYFNNPTGIMAEKWTPKRLNQVYATREQFEQFVQNGYYKAATHTLGLYFYYLLENIDNIRNKSIYKQEYNELKKEFKKSLKDKKSYIKQNNMNIEWALYRAYPSYRLLNTLKAIVKKVMGLVKK